MKHRVADLLQPGELSHLRAVAAWQKRPYQGVVVDEVRRQHGRYPKDAMALRNKPRGIHADMVAAQPTPLDLAMSADSVRAAMCMLTPRQRRVVTMRVEGHNNYQIAKALKCTHHNIEYLLRETRRILRGVYAEHAARP